MTAIRSSKAGQHLIGIVSRITRKAGDETAIDGAEEDPEATLPENNLVRVALIGTLVNKEGLKENVFKRTLETVPEIDADCFSLEGQRLTDFMQVISQVSGDGPQLDLGRYALDEDARDPIDEGGLKIIIFGLSFLARSCTMYCPSLSKSVLSRLTTGRCLFSPRSTATIRRHGPLSTLVSLPDPANSGPFYIVTLGTPGYVTLGYILWGIYCGLWGLILKFLN